MTYTLERRQAFPRPLDEVFAFFSDPANLAAITPPWLRFWIVGMSGGAMQRGLRIEYRISPPGIPQKWVSEITTWDPPHRFIDEQVQGPYRFWRHEHPFERCPSGTVVHDTVHYALPFGPLGRIVHGLFVRRRLRAIFDHRHEQLERLLA